MRVLVIGGTGFLGTHVVNRLIDKKYDVFLFNKDGSSREEVREVILEDRKNIKKYRNKFESLKLDVVIDVVPYFKKDAEDVITTFKGITRKLVAISSSDVYYAFGILNNLETGSIVNDSLTEKSKLRKSRFIYHGVGGGMDEYEKIHIEEVYMKSEDINITILRVPMIYGPGDRYHRLFEYIKRMADDRPCILMEEGFSQWKWSKIYVKNLVEAVLLTIESGKSNGKIYNVASSETVTMKEWVLKIGRVFGWEGKIFSLSPDALPDRFCTSMNTKQNIIIDSSLIRKELYYKEKYSIEEAIKETIDWENENPPKNIPLGYFDYKLENEIIKTHKLIPKVKTE